MDSLVRHTQQINQQLARYGVKFGIYKNGTFQERLFPFDAIPRVITHTEWQTLEQGLVQLGLVAAVELQLLLFDAQLFRDLDDGL